MSKIDTTFPRLSIAYLHSIIYALDVVHLENIAIMKRLGMPDEVIKATTDEYENISRNLNCDMDNIFSGINNSSTTTS